MGVVGDAGGSGDATAEADAAGVASAVAAGLAGSFFVVGSVFAGVFAEAEAALFLSDVAAEAGGSGIAAAEGALDATDADGAGIAEFADDPSLWACAEFAAVGFAGSVTGAGGSSLHPAAKTRGRMKNRRLCFMPRFDDASPRSA